MRLPKTNFKMDYFPLAGGEDLITPTITVKPGRALFTQNYELDVNGRYRLIDGYEAFDGRPKPSEASYWTLDFYYGENEISVGDTIEGAGATGEVLAITVESGTWITNNAAGTLILFNVTGSYVDAENLIVGVTTMAVCDGTELERGAATDELDITYLLAAIEATRDDIGAVTGSGNVLGVWQYNGVKYAFRNNSGGTECQMWKSSTIGWTAVILGETLSFDTGSVEFVEGETATAGAVSAVIRRIVVTSGTWAGGDAAGYFTISGRAGGNFSAGALTGSVSGAANATGAETANTFSPDGSFKFINENFGGNAGTRRMYGINGVDRGFEFDGTYFTWITTGMTTDTPIDLIAHRNHLFFAFAGGSLQHSGPGTPFVWSVVLGAAEIGLGDEITGLVSLKPVLALFGRNSTKLLYGSSVSDWDLQGHSDESGAIANTLQKIGSGVYLDDRGLTTIAATDKYGDFQANSISEYVDPFLQTMLESAQNSMRVKKKNQYRLFFDNNEVLTMTIKGGDIIGFTRQAYDHLVTCACSSENSTGAEELFIGSDDGYVYQLDAGTSFNGDAFQAFIKFHYNHLKSPSIEKRIRKIVLELSAKIHTYIRASVEFDHGESDGSSETFAVESVGGLWDVSLWDAFIWTGQSTASAPLDIDGTGQNFSLSIAYSGEWENQEEGGRTGLTGAEPHTIQGYTVHYDYRRVQR